jgi:hypothetical protein
MLPKLPPLADQLRVARDKAARTAQALQRATQAQYPTMAPAGAAHPAQPLAQPAVAPAYNAANAAAARPSQAPLQPAAAQPAHPAQGYDQRNLQLAQRQLQQATGQGAANYATGQLQGTPGYAAIAHANAAGAQRAANDQQLQLQADAIRRQRLKGDLMQQSMKLANPNASPLQLDMARRGVVTQ